MRVALTGSYNGRDSLGVEWAVVERVQHHRPDASVNVQRHGTDSAFICAYKDSDDPSIGRGLQSALWRCSHVLQRLRVPQRLAAAAVKVSVHLAARLGAFGAREAIEDLKQTDAFFIFGGTQFSVQWFRLNAPAYLRSAEIVCSSGGRVFSGAQQYGPLTETQAAILRAALKSVVTDWRTRNHLYAGG